MSVNLLNSKAKFRGVLFDFNGTLFWDTHLHNAAWNKFLEKHQLQLTDEEKNQKIHGKNNQDIFTALFQRSFTKEEIDDLVIEKETIYQNLCLNIKMELAPGAIEFFEFLHSQSIPFTIATASGIENIDFYFSHLNLGKWFDYKTIVYNDGSFPGKPQPDIFLIGAKRLGIAPEYLIVFEDSLTGFKAAQNAKIGKIYIVNSTNNDQTWPCDVISSFTEVDRSLFG